MTLKNLQLITLTDKKAKISGAEIEFNWQEIMHDSKRQNEELVKMQNRLQNLEEVINDKNHELEKQCLNMEINGSKQNELISNHYDNMQAQNEMIDNLRKDVNSLQQVIDGKVVNQNHYKLEVKDDQLFLYVNGSLSTSTNMFSESYTCDLNFLRFTAFESTRIISLQDIFWENVTLWTKSRFYDAGINVLYDKKIWQSLFSTSNYPKADEKWKEYFKIYICDENFDKQIEEGDIYAYSDKTVFLNKEKKRTEIKL